MLVRGFPHRKFTVLSLSGFKGERRASVDQ